MYNFNKDLIYFIKRDGTSENPYKDITEDIHVLYEKAFLQEVPVQSFKVSVKLGTADLIEVNRIEDITSGNQFFVNYKQGIVYFHNSQNSKKVNLKYRGQGVLLYPASRIYIESESGAKDVVKTLKDLISEGEKSLDAVKQVSIIIGNANRAIETMNTAIIDSNNAIGTINSKISEFSTNELSRIAQENVRKINEERRVLSEQERVEAEAERKINSEDYDSAELERREKEDERISSEEDRIKNENARIDSETERSISEDNRIKAEKERVTRDELSTIAESNRKISEDKREFNENNRILEEIKRDDAEKQRKINSENYELKELARDSKETDRLSAEIQRINNENIRMEAENTRSAKETERINAENERINSYLLILEEESLRISAENERKLNEENRISNEEIRINTHNEIKAIEQLRISAEVERVIAESIRDESENSRQLTFNDSINEFNKLKTDVQKATSDSVTAVTRANEKITNLQDLIDNTGYHEVFDIDKTYHKNNIVSYNGSSHIAKGETKGNLPTNEVYWGLLAQRGIDGKGSIVTINDLSPDLNGNVNLTAEVLNAEKTANKGVANGYAGLDANGKIPLNQVPDTLKQQTYVVADENERNQLTNLMSGDKAFEKLTGDSYIFDGIQWNIFADADWENVSLDWTNISNKPVSSVENIDKAVSDSHRHANKDVLDGFAIIEGKLKHNDLNIGNVDSVNGKTGEVTITSEDVGAYSKSQTYSKVEVNSLIDNHTSIEVLDSTPITFDKIGILYIKKSNIDIEIPE